MASYSVSIRALCQQIRCNRISFQSSLTLEKFKVSLILGTWLFSLSSCFPFVLFSSVYRDGEFSYTLNIGGMVKQPSLLSSLVQALLLLHHSVQLSFSQESIVPDSKPEQWRNKTRRKTVYSFILIVSVSFFVG